MKEWIKKLLSDYSGNPSTRLVLAFALIFILAIYIFTKDNPQSEIVWALICGASGMAGLSVVDKSSIKNEVPNGKTSNQGDNN